MIESPRIATPWRPTHITSPITSHHQFPSPRCQHCPAITNLSETSSQHFHHSIPTNECPSSRLLFFFAIFRASSGQYTGCVEEDGVSGGGGGYRTGWSGGTLHVAWRSYLFSGLQQLVCAELECSHGLQIASSQCRYLS